MNSNRKPILTVPTNIITGFLGVGKTSTILHLMQSKPANERWAILVNEFGEIGVDGSLYQGQHNEGSGIYIREVPGGCMCCAAGLPMQIALNQLLNKARPDRLIIEPTGLGHPKEVLQVLSSDNYRDTLSLQKTLTLVDARKISDPRYTNHDIFNQQIAIADTIIANKEDLYQNADHSKLIDYVKKWGKNHAHVLFTQYGRIELSTLLGPISDLPQQSHHQNHKNHTKILASDLPIPECGFIKAMNEGDGFNSVGWRFSPNKVFNHQQLYSFLSDLQAERMKAVFITDKGMYAYNLISDTLNEIKLNNCMESRIEIISGDLNNSLEAQLLSCIVS